MPRVEHPVTFRARIDPSVVDQLCHRIEIAPLGRVVEVDTLPVPPPIFPVRHTAFSIVPPDGAGRPDPPTPESHASPSPAAALDTSGPREQQTATPLLQKGIS